MSRAAFWRTPTGLLGAAALDQVAVSLAQQGIAVLAVAFRSATQISVAQMSVLMAAVAFGAVLGMIPAGLSHDRLGARPTAWVSGAWAFVALGLLGLLLPRAFGLLLVLLVLLGISLPALSLVSLGTVTTVFQGTRHQGLAVGIRQAAGPLGGVAAASLLPWIAHEWPLSRVLMLLAVNLGVFTVFMAMILPRRRPPPRARTVSLLSLGRRIKGPLWASFLLAPGQYALLTFAVLDLHDVGGRRTVSAGILLAAALLSGLAARLLLGHIRDRGASTPRLLRLSAGIGAAALLVWAVMPRDQTLVVLTALFIGMGFGLDGWNALVASWITDRSDRAERGLALGLAGTAGLLGVIVWLPVFGWLHRTFRSYRPGWLLVAVLSVVLILTLAGPRSAEPAKPS
ncbi:MAG: MFS transporter [Clostridia bacterium]